MPIEMRADMSEDSDDDSLDEEDDSDNDERMELYSGKKSVKERETGAGNKINEQKNVKEERPSTNQFPSSSGKKRPREEQKSDSPESNKENVAQRLVINQRIVDSKRKLADQLLSKKSQVTDQRWETDRATAKMVDFVESEDAEMSIFADAFYGFQKEHEQSGAPQGAPSSLSVEEKLRMTEFLFSKVRHNHMDVIMSCIKGKMHDMSAVDDKGNTLLHISCQNNLKKMTALLIKDGGFSLLENMNRRNHKGMTPLDYCELYQFDKLGDYISLHGADRGSGSHRSKK